MADRELITEYYLKYRESLLIIAASYTHNMEDAEDLVHSAFTKALLSYDSSGSFLCWANRVMRNEWYNMIKVRGRTSEKHDASEIADTDGDPLALLIADENRKRLSQYISNLPERYRDIMIEAVYLGRSDIEIAKDHGLKESNVRQIRSRAKKMIIEKVKRDDRE